MTPEDEAFDDLAKKQGAWGGGFKAKQAMAADKMQEPAKKPVSFPCCGYTDANAIRCNQFNGVVQCHMCGQVYTVAQPAQEPVAYLCENAVGHKYFRWKKPSSSYKPIPLYTTPSQRPWVGLTDEEIAQGNKESWVDRQAFESAVWWAEAKLKEKNG